MTTKNLKLYKTINVADDYVAAVVFGDVSGLSDEMEVALDQFEQTLPPNSELKFGTYQYDNFLKCAISGIVTNCIAMSVYTQ